MQRRKNLPPNREEENYLHYREKNGCLHLIVLLYFDTIQHKLNSKLYSLNYHNNQLTKKERPENSKKVAHFSSNNNNNNCDGNI